MWRKLIFGTAPWPHVSSPPTPSHWQLDSPPSSENINVHHQPQSLGLLNGHSYIEFRLPSQSTSTRHSSNSGPTLLSLLATLNPRCRALPCIHPGWRGPTPDKARSSMTDNGRSHGGLVDTLFCSGAENANDRLPAKTLLHIQIDVRTDCVTSHWGDFAGLSHRHQLAKTCVS